MKLKMFIIVFFSLSATLSHSMHSKSLYEERFVFCIVESFDEDFFNVWINPLYYWKEYGLLADNYTKQEMKKIAPILERYELHETMRSIYELKATQSKSDFIEKFKEENQLIYSTSFQNWCEDYN